MPAHQKKKGRADEKSLRQISRDIMIAAATVAVIVPLTLLATSLYNQWTAPKKKIEFYSPVAKNLVPTRPAKSSPISSRFEYEVKIANKGQQAATDVEFSIEAPPEVTLNESSIETVPAGIEHLMKPSESRVPKHPEIRIWKVSLIDKNQTLILHYVGETFRQIPSSRLHVKILAKDFSIDETPSPQSELNPVRSTVDQSNALKARNHTGGSSDTADVYFHKPTEVTILAIPPGLNPGSRSSPGPTPSSTSVSLSWIAPSGATSYGLGVRDIAGGILVVNTTVTSPFSTTNLTAGKQYRWNLNACKSAGCSSHVSDVYFETPGSLFPIRANLLNDPPPASTIPISLGGQPVPVFFVSPNLINAQAVEMAGTYQVKVQNSAPIVPCDPVGLLVMIMQHRVAFNGAGSRYEPDAIKDWEFYADHFVRNSNGAVPAEMHFVAHTLGGRVSFRDETPTREINNTLSVQPSATGTFTSPITIKDSAGQVSTTSGNVRANAPPSFTGAYSISPSTITLGNGATVTASASGGQSPHQDLLGTSGAWGNNNTIGFVPAATGTFTSPVSITVRAGSNATFTGTHTGGTNPVTVGWYAPAVGKIASTLTMLFPSPSTSVFTYIAVDSTPPRQPKSVDCSITVVAAEPALTSSCTISPRTITLGNGATVTATATGEQPPYQYLLGALDARGTNQTITVLPSVNGTPTGTWTITGVDDGLHGFDRAARTTSGAWLTPITASTTGTYTVTLTVTDSATNTVRVTAPVVVTTGSGTRQWVIGTSMLNVPGYNVTASGGTARYQWSATGLPPGLTMSSAPGSLSGTPTAADGFPIMFPVAEGTGLNGSWLTINGQSSYAWTAPATVTVKSDPAGLAPGTYNGTITPTSTQATNSPLVVPVTTLITPKPVTISVSHTGTFSAGQSNATYSITADNNGAVPTSGMVTVTEMTLVSMAGTGWDCPANTCTRTNVLRSSYPSITATITFASNAPSLVNNHVNWSEGGSATANASDSTVTTASNLPPSAVSITPSSGSRSSQTVTFMFSDPNGFADPVLDDRLIKLGVATDARPAMWEPWANSGNLLTFTTARRATSSNVSPQPLKVAVLRTGGGVLTVTSTVVGTDTEGGGLDAAHPCSRIASCVEENGPAPLRVQLLHTGGGDLAISSTVTAAHNTRADPALAQFARLRLTQGGQQYSTTAANARRVMLSGQPRQLDHPSHKTWSGYYRRARPRQHGASP